MKLKIITNHDARVSVTLDDDQLDEECPQLDTPAGLLSLRVDDRSDDDNDVRVVVSPHLSSAEAIALGDALSRWGERRAGEEEGEQRARRMMQDVQNVMDGAAESVGRMVKDIEQGSELPPASDPNGNN